MDMEQMLRRAVQNMDEETAREALRSLPDEDIGKAANYAMSEMLVPHLEDVRQRADVEDPSPEQVRQQFQQNLTADEREELFYDTLDSVVVSLITLREKPQQGLRELKTMLRDPYTQEALLVIFENEDHIDAAYTEEMKDFTATIFHHVGAMVLPEMYPEQAVRDAEDWFGIE